MYRRDVTPWSCVQARGDPMVTLIRVMSIPIGLHTSDFYWANTFHHCIFGNPAHDFGNLSASIAGSHSCTICPRTFVWSLPITASIGLLTSWYGRSTHGPQLNPLAPKCPPRIECILEKILKLNKTLPIVIFNS